MQKRTIQDIANACNLSASMVSKIETDNVIPSVATLVKIAKALGTNVSVLLEENRIRTSVLSEAERVENNMTKTKTGYHIYPFAPEYEDKIMQPFLFVANKGEVKEHHLSHEGEEFVYVLEGQVRIQVNDRDYLLNKGDSVYFNSLEQHSIMPVSRTAKYLNLFV